MICEDSTSVTSLNRNDNSDVDETGDGIAHHYAKHLGEATSPCRKGKGDRESIAAPSDRSKPPKSGGSYLKVDDGKS